MSRFNKKVSESSGFEPPPEGAYYAACVALVDLGTHEDEYNGDVTSNEKIYLAWELLGQVDSKGRAFVVAREFNFYISPTSKFGKFLADWRGKKLSPQEDVDVRKVLGAKCQLTIGHKKSTKNNKERIHVEVLTATPIVKGTQTPGPTVSPFLWDPDQGPFREPEWLPRLYGKKIADVIGESLEARGHGATAATATAQAQASQAIPDPGDAAEDDIPF